MFERYNTDAQYVVTTARRLAKGMGHRKVATGHLLYALLSIGPSPVQEALNLLGLHSSDVFKAVRDSRVGTTATPSIGTEAAYESDLTDILRYKALRVSLKLGFTEILPEHLLLGMLQSDRCEGVRLIELGGATREQVRRAITNSMVSPPPVRIVKHKLTIDVNMPDSLLAILEAFGEASPEYSLALADFLEELAPRLRLEAGE